ncbi:MAG TPA: hypothetical protein VFD09_10655 [Thiopseudomonas sp.]|nr:hypothetical protein [Thiopseudomonas sp.]
MNRCRVISTGAAGVAFFILCWLFSGAPDNVGLLASLDPVSAVQGLAFTLSFAAGVPAVVALVAAIAVFVCVPVVVFLLVRRLKLCTLTVKP